MENYYSSVQEVSASPANIISSLIVGILTLIAFWKILEKAGVPGWAALIPFYNTYMLFKITWGNGWKFLLLLIPIAGIVFYIITNVKLAKAFGKGGGFAVGLILLGVVFYCILGFGKDVYLGVPQKA